MIKSETISLQTQGNCDIIDITSQVNDVLVKSGVESGMVMLFVTGSTAGITTIEYEPGLVTDLKEMWQRLVPENIPYLHDRAWGDGNGHAHIRAALLGASLVIPVANKRMTLGTWQQIVLLDFDNRPRQRYLVVQATGE
jgi:secondary thiamine-phosphate synthase enzyme